MMEKYQNLFCYGLQGGDEVCCVNVHQLSNLVKAIWPAGPIPSLGGGGGGMQNTIKRDEITLFTVFWGKALLWDHCTLEASLAVTPKSHSFYFGF